MGHKAQIIVTIPVEFLTVALEAAYTLILAPHHQRCLSLWVAKDRAQGEVLTAVEEVIVLMKVWGSLAVEVEAHQISELVPVWLVGLWLVAVVAGQVTTAALD